MDSEGKELQMRKAALLVMLIGAITFASCAPTKNVNSRTAAPAETSVVTEAPATPEPVVTAEPPIATDNISPPNAQSCDPAYPDFCIPPPPPDLNCSDVAPHHNFTVKAPDPHGFDQDGDGIGCEKK